jgi:hypothetical protein
MRIFRTAFLFLISVAAINLAMAQEPQTPQRELTPQGIQTLRQFASSKTEFSLDHGMLVFASKLDSENEDLRRVIAGVSGVSVHRYRYPGNYNYDPDAVEEVKSEYHSAGWKQLMNNHSKDGGPGTNNVWIRFQNNAISDVAMLFARSNEVDYVVVTGSISPMDLSHLGGHFGIPKIEGGVLVPDDHRHDR